jgi:hypothetical protein
MTMWRGMRLQVGARLLTSATRQGFVGPQLRVDMAVTQRSYSVAFKYLYGAGTAPNVFNVTITAVDPAQLTNENTGLLLRINGINVTVGVAWAAWEMDNTIEAALGAPFNSLETNFGVFKSLSEDGKSVMLLLATAPNISAINITAATLAWPLYPFTPSPCTWANPLMAVTFSDPPNPTIGMA